MRGRERGRERRRVDERNKEGRVDAVLNCEGSPLIGCTSLWKPSDWLHFSVEAL